MTNKINGIDVSECPCKDDDKCLEVPILNEYGDLIDYQDCEPQTLCPYRSKTKIQRLQEENEKQKEQIKQLEDFIKSDGEIDHINHEYTYKLKKENEGLKEEILKWQTAYSRQYQINENKGYNKKEEQYRQTLQEIKEIAEPVKKDICNNCGWQDSDGCEPEGCACNEFITILHKINEVINEK